MESLDYGKAWTNGRINLKKVKDRICESLGETIQKNTYYFGYYFAGNGIRLNLSIEGNDLSKIPEIEKILTDEDFKPIKLK